MHNILLTPVTSWKLLFTLHGQRHFRGWHAIWWIGRKLVSNLLSSISSNVCAVLWLVRFTLLRTASNFVSVGFGVSFHPIFWNLPILEFEKFMCPKRGVCITPNHRKYPAILYVIWLWLAVESKLSLFSTGGVRKYALSHLRCSGHFHSLRCTHSVLATTTAAATRT